MKYGLLKGFIILFGGMTITWALSFLYIHLTLHFTQIETHTIGIFRFFNTGTDIHGEPFIVLHEGFWIFCMSAGVYLLGMWMVSWKIRKLK